MQERQYLTLAENLSKMKKNRICGLKGLTVFQTGLVREQINISNIPES